MLLLGCLSRVKIKGFLICGYGGIGRRARFRFWSGQLGGGSSPLIRTRKIGSILTNTADFS